MLRTLEFERFRIPVFDDDFFVSYCFNLYCTIVSPRKAQRPEVG